MVPPMEAMQEFKVEVNSMGAEYGRSSAGVVQAVTRSGNNEIHGVMYDYVRNDVFDAISWNNKRNENPTKPKLRQNRGGGGIRGPLMRNKTFYSYTFDFFLNPRDVNRIRECRAARMAHRRLLDRHAQRRRGNASSCADPLIQ